MAAQAEYGTRKSIEVNLGKDVSFVEIKDKSVRIVMKWGKNRIIYSDINLICDERIYSGKNFLMLELKKDGGKYVEIQVEK